MDNRVIAAVALGSNMGDRPAHLRFARARLATILDNARFSAAIETAPVGVPDAQPPFLNAAAVGETVLPARKLLEALLAIEREAGRERRYAGAARTLDLDLVLYGSAIIDAPDLQVPHPRFRERRFVLEPLAAIASDLVDPVTGLNVGDLLRRVP